MDNEYIILSNSLPFEESGYSAQTPQKLVRLLPLGLVHSTKGDFLVDDESFRLIRCKFMERQLQIPIDYEHQTLKDMQAPAAGWVKEITLKSDGIYGAVDWTERAAEYLKNREYKYISPVVTLRNADKKAVGLHSAALTNTPAIDAMTPIARSDKPSGNEDSADQEGAENSGKDTFEALAALLQLDPSATMDDIYKAVAALLEGQETLKLKADACQFEVVRMKADGVVEEALRAGKVLPFQRDWAFQSAMNDFDSFTLWLKSAPQVVPMGEVCPETLPQAQRHHSRAYELMGLSAEDVQRYGGNEGTA